MGQESGWRLAPGAHAVPEGTGGLLLVSPTEQVARVRLPAGDQALLLEVLAERRTPAEALRAASDPDLFQEVLDGCVAEGIAGPVRASVAIHAGKVSVAGDNPLAAALAPVLTAAGFAPARPGHDSDVDTEVLVACAGWLPDHRWQEIDAQRLGAGRPWHRCHLEGTRIVVGPFSLPGGPSYHDTRTRRLAACAWPDELEVLWAHLETAADLPAEPWPDPGGCSVVAGLIAADLVAYRAGRRPPGADRQLVLDPADLSWRAHPVLPLPTGIMVSR